MRKLLMVLPLLLGSLVGATEVLPVEYTNFTKEIECKAKYERIEGKDFTKIEALLGGRIQQTDSWADVKLKFTLQNPDVVDSFLDINLDRCLIGYTTYASDMSEVYIEAGRAKMEDMFISKLQHKCHLNGVHVSYGYDNIRIHTAAHVIDYVENNYGMVGEVTYSNLFDLPVLLHYSINHWLNQDPFLISQIGASYLVAQPWNKNLVVYSQFLRNHKSSAHSNGYVAGSSIGSKEQAKDWMLDINYQYAGASSIPAYDFNGIGIVKKKELTDTRGAKIKATYCVTDRLSLEAKAALLVGSAENRYEIAAVYNW